MDTGRPTGRGQKGSADDKPLRRVDNTLRRVFRCTPTAPGSAATLPHHAPETPHASMGETSKTHPEAGEGRTSRRGAKPAPLYRSDGARGNPRQNGPQDDPAESGGGGRRSRGRPARRQDPGTGTVGDEGPRPPDRGPSGRRVGGDGDAGRINRGERVATHSSQKADNPGKDTPEKTRPQTPLARAAAHSASANPSEPKARRRFEHLTTTPATTDEPMT